jgi:hypothetical protein
MVSLMELVREATSPVVERSNDTLGFWLRDSADNKVLARAYALVNPKGGYDLHMFVTGGFPPAHYSLGHVEDSATALDELKEIIDDYKSSSEL